MSMSGLKKIRYKIEYLFILAWVLVAWMVPLKTILDIADVVGWLIFSILRVRRRVVLDNLTLAFPEKTKKEIETIALRAYQNFTKMVVEYIRFPLIKKDELLSLGTVVGKEHLDWALRHGKGGVLVAGHFGNWELMGAYLVQVGYPVSFLVGQQHNRFVDDMMNRHRERMGIRIIHMGVAVRGVLKALRSNEFVALLSDQDAGREGIFVEFFGRKASVHQGPAIFALKTGAPIIFGSAIRLPMGKHRFIVQKQTFDHLHEVTPKNIQTVTEAYTRLLEQAIRLHPDHWFWMHRRWKTRPPDQE